MIDVRVLDTPHDVACAAADLAEAVVRREPEALLGVATGSTPLALYDELARRHVRDGLCFATAHAVLLDEYVGLSPCHPERYRNVVLRGFAEGVGMPASNVHSPEVDTDDLATACQAYEDTIDRLGPVDLQVLGLGSDGHIAFNMPGSPADSLTRLTALTDQTIRDNARFFDGDTRLVPREAVTQGLATIMRARAIVMLVTGRRKSEALQALRVGPASEAIPATVLRTHPRTTVLVDRAAAGLDP